MGYLVFRWFSSFSDASENLTTMHKKLVLCRRDITHAQHTINERASERAARVSRVVPLTSPTPTFQYTLDSVSLSYAMSVFFSFFF